MPLIRPIRAVRYADQAGSDLSALIAPPYDVLDEQAKANLLAAHPHNVVAIDLPHLPPHTVGPDEVYEKAGDIYRDWLSQQVLVRDESPALFVYHQTYTLAQGQGPNAGQTVTRRGLIANVKVQPFGQSTDGTGGIHPHEQTFSGPKQDRMKLMCATRAQLSPIFGMYSDDLQSVQHLLAQATQAKPASFKATTANDGVLHEVWAITDPDRIAQLSQAVAGKDIYIADGHHRYNTALNYRDKQLAEKGSLSPDDPANFCTFVLIAMQDPGMLVLPTHRVLGSMTGFSLEKFAQAGEGKLKVQPFGGTTGSLADLAAALPKAGPHAIGLYGPTQAGDQPAMAIATTPSPDPLADAFPDHTQAWRQLDVAIVQHLIVEQLCQPKFANPGTEISWKFPHSLDELKTMTDADRNQLGLVMQPAPLEGIKKISNAGELMPQKSTFFYPKLATGLLINPLE